MEPKKEQLREMKKTLHDKIKIQSEILDKIIKRLNMASNVPVLSDDESDKGNYSSLLASPTSWII